MRHPLVIVCGNPGTGKSTHGQRLAKQLGAALLDLDTVSERLVQVGLVGHGLDPNDRDSPRYKQLYREVIHDTLFDIAAENLAHVPVVLVAPFTRERRLADWPKQLRERFDTEVRILCTYCSPAERKRRIAERANPRDGAKLQAWETYAGSGEGAERPAFEHEWIDTT